MVVGLEPELSVVVDVFYPIDAITQVAKEFREQYPGVALRIYVEALGAAIQPVLDGRCSVGIVGPLPVIPDTLTNERLPGISYLMVVASDHPLTLHKGNIPREVLGKFTQIVLTDRSELSAGRELGVMSPTAWRLADLFRKASLSPQQAWLGWYAAARLVVLPIEDVPPGGLNVQMSAVWHTGSPPGPAGRWFIERLKEIPVPGGDVPGSRAAATRKRGQRARA
jgi:DNA-binding transcriptional LysR family regulator